MENAGATRVFIALPVSHKLLQFFGACEVKLSHLLAPSKPGESAPVRWLDPEGLHITLIPPWQERDTKTVLSKISAFQNSTGPVTIEFHTIEFGPTAGAPRLIWASGSAPPEVGALKARLEKTLELPAASRLFSPHVTLARFHERDFARFLQKKLREKIARREMISSFVLLESYLLPDGARYKTLAEFPL